MNNEGVRASTLENPRTTCSLALHVLGLGRECQKVSIMDRMCVSSQNSYVEVLTLNVMIFGDGASGGI